MSDLAKRIKADVAAAADKNARIHELRQLLHELSPCAGEPIDFVRWVPIERVVSNSYNPNSVAKVEMQLLYTSILHDHYTQPIVTIVRKKGEIFFPCGHSILVDSENDKEESPIWTLIDPLSGSSDTLLELSTVREASPTYLEAQGNASAGSESRLHRLNQTTVLPSVNGSESSGTSDASIHKPASAKPGSGTSHVSTTSNTFLELVCPTCLSSDPGRKKSWTTSLAGAGTGAGSGLCVSWISCAPKGLSCPPKNSPPPCEEASTPSAQSETNSDLRHHPGTAGSALRCINHSHAVIIDGFHRYFTMKAHADIRERTGGLLPVVVLDKDINDRMASTVRHNRARGKHSVSGMSSMVFKMLENGWDDAAICQELGMTAEELVRLKHVTGFSKLFENTEYRKAWMTERQIRIAKSMGAPLPAFAGGSSNAAGDEDTEPNAQP